MSLIFSTRGPFGEQTYGEPWWGGTVGLDPLDPRRYGARLTARPVGYGIIGLSWSFSNTEGVSEFAVVRAGFGYPISRYEGVTVLTGSPQGSRRSTDDGQLGVGRWFYYSLFVRDELSGRWVRVATAGTVSVRDWGYHDDLWRNLPGFYRTMDRNLVQSEQEGPLYRFLQLFAFEMSLLRTFAGSTEVARSISEIGAPMLPNIAADFGVHWEETLGSIRMRSILQHLLMWRKDKGSLDALSGMARAISGCNDAHVAVVPNIMLDHNDSGFTESIGRWIAVDGCTIERTHDLDPGPRVDHGYLRVTATEDGDATLANATVGNIVKEGIKVQPGEPYTASAYIRHADELRVAAIHFEWYDKNGEQVFFEGLFDTESWGPVGEVVHGEVHRSGPAGSGTPGTGGGGLITVQTGQGTTTGWDTRIRVTALAPFAARWARVVVFFADVEEGEIHYVDSVQVEKGFAMTTWQPARKLMVYSCGARANLVLNPSFEVGSGNWTKSANTNAYATTDDSRFGAASLFVEANDPGPVSLSTTISPIRPESHLTVSTYIKAMTSDLQLSMELEWLDEEDQSLGSSGYQNAVPIGDWRRRGFTALSPAGAVSARLTISTTLGEDDVFALDGVLAEASPLRMDYFDGTFGGPDYGWIGTVNSSPSRFIQNRQVFEDVMTRYLNEFVPASTPWEIAYIA